MLNKSDLKQIKEKGIDSNDIEKQLAFFRNGFPFMQLYSPATIDNKGIDKFDKSKIESLVKLFDSVNAGKEIIKFVPASGAASRMFKSLFSFNENYNANDNASDYLEKNKSVSEFFNGLKRFAFYNDLINALKKDNISSEDCLHENKFNVIIDYLLLEKGLNYASLPKGLLKFHKYENVSRTAFEEHFVEAANYCRNEQNISNLHFTISPEHIDIFNQLLDSVLKDYEALLDVKFNINYSIQKPSTDTIAVDMNNGPFRENDGSLVFRPGGHGALIENLNDLQGDIIFIKNIDNIVPDRLKGETYLYKKVIAAYLIEIQQQIHEYLNDLASDDISDERLKTIIEYADRVLKIPTENIPINEKDKTIKFLFSKLNRPVRVCGMVKNEGEPGGGPFWVKNNNEVSLQIVESSQVNLADAKQKEIFNSSTHFNPVDLVCGVNDYQGKKFNLLNYSDPNTGFISVKSKDGRDLKALELPGLWNGAMAHWITVFVEVPVITFNPVKTVNDLLKKEHQ